MTLLVAGLLLGMASPAPAVSGQARYTGVNLAGADFGEGSLPSGVYIYTLRSGMHFAARRLVVTR